VKHLNLICEQPTGLDINTASSFLINGLKRDELIATNSMIPARALLCWPGRGECTWRGEFHRQGQAARWRFHMVLLSRSHPVSAQPKCVRLATPSQASSANNSCELTVRDSRVLTGHTWSAEK